MKTRTITQLLSESPAHFVTFRAKDPLRPIRLHLSQGNRSVEVQITGTSLALVAKLDGTGTGAIETRHRIPVGDRNARYLVGLCERIGGGLELLCARDGTILAAVSSPIHPAPVRFQGDNILFEYRAWDTLKIAGQVSAPSENPSLSLPRRPRAGALLLLKAPRRLATQIAARLEEVIGDALEVILLGEDDSEILTGTECVAEVLAAISDAEMLRQVIIRNHDTLSVIVVQNERLSDPDDIVAALSGSGTNSTVLFSGGYAQRIITRNLLAIDLLPEPFAVSDEMFETANIRLAPSALPTDASPRLAEALDALREGITEDARAIAVTPTDGMTMIGGLERVAEFWTVSAEIDGSDALGMEWMLRTFFGFGTVSGPEARRLLRRITAVCERQRISVLGTHLTTGEGTIEYLVDVRLLALARDATFALGLHSFASWLEAFEPERVQLRELERDGRRLAFLHLRDGHTENLAPKLLERLSETVANTRDGDPRTESRKRLAQLAGHWRDLSLLVSTLKALGRKGQRRLDDPRIVDLLSKHPEAFPAIAEFALSKSGPSAVAGVMSSIEAIMPRLSSRERTAIVETCVDARTFASLAPIWRQDLHRLAAKDRLRAALQLVEGSNGRLPRAEQTLATLRLEERDRNFVLLVNHLKDGNPGSALAFGRSVLHERLHPWHRADVLAVALFSEDAEEARRLLAELPEPLHETDQLFLDTWHELLTQGLTSDKRVETTKRILDSDPAYADLKIKGRRYRELSDFDSPPEPGRDVICVITARNEASRIGDVMDHHANLGVRHFILIDNMSSDGTVAIAREMGAKVIQTSESYRASRYGMAWVNDVLDRYCTGFWSLVIDADEMLVYPEMETLGLADFAARLESEGYEAMSTVLLDMYPEAPISRLGALPRGALRETYNLFDAGNLTFWPRLRSPLMGISGGVRDRLFRIGRFGKLAPIAHTKTPLVRWQRGMKYLTSTHDITPVRTPPCYAVLEHYKYTPDFVLRAKREVLRREHWDGASEYSAYASVLETEPDLSFIDPSVTRRREESTKQIAAVSPFRWPPALLPERNG